MNSALLTYFIPAAFPPCRMYQGHLRPLEQSLVADSAMVTIASPYAIWVLKQARRCRSSSTAATMDGATTMQLFRLVYVPLMMPSLVAIAPTRSCSPERISLRLPAAVEGYRDHASGRARWLLAADDLPELLMTTGLSTHCRRPRSTTRSALQVEKTAGAVKS